MSYTYTHEQIVFDVSIKGVSPEESKKVTYLLKRGGVEEISKGTIDLSTKSYAIKTKLNKPGSFVLTISVPLKNKKYPFVKRAGAIVDIDNIPASMPKPKDFDEFWDKKLALQKSIPMNAVLKPESKSQKGVKSWILRMDTINNQKIHGRLAKPEGKGKYPALLVAQWAGVYGLSPKWAQNYAANGWLCLNVTAHDIPIDKDKSYYQELSRGKLKGYNTQGSEDREKSYFLRMNLGAARAVDYLSKHPEWNGKTLVVTGSSQGGYQAIVAAALNKKVTAIMASVPACTDNTAHKVNRSPSWPF